MTTGFEVRYRAALFDNPPAGRDAAIDCDKWERYPAKGARSVRYSLGRRS